jgi:hypothetical protein
MLPELARLIDSLDQRTDEVLAELEEMSPEQRRFRADGETWSPVMVAHHLALFEVIVAGRLEARESGRKRRRRVRQKLLYPIVNLILRSGFKVKVPSQRVVPDPDLDLAAVRTCWLEARQTIRAALEGIGPQEVCEEAYRHPIAGPVDFREGIALMIDHLDHHRRQLQRIQRAPGFPAAAI